MADINFTIPDAKLDRVKTGMLAIYPNNETILDSSWTEPTEENPTQPQIPRYTDNQWLKERVRRFVVDSVRRAEQIVAQNAAKETLLEADSIIS